jgi:hypothetical protein
MSAMSGNAGPGDGYVEKDQMMTGPLSVLMYSAKNNAR